MSRTSQHFIWVLRPTHPHLPSKTVRLPSWRYTLVAYVIVLLLFVYSRQDAERDWSDVRSCATSVLLQWHSEGKDLLSSHERLKHSQSYRQWVWSCKNYSFILLHYRSTLVRLQTSAQRRVWLTRKCSVSCTGLPTQTRASTAPTCATKSHPVPKRGSFSWDQETIRGRWSSTVVHREWITMVYFLKIL